VRTAFGFIATWMALGLFLLAGVMHSAGQAHAQANDIAVAAQLHELVGDLDDTEVTRSLIADLLIMCSPDEETGAQDLLGRPPIVPCALPRLLRHVLPVIFRQSRSQ